MGSHRTPANRDLIPQPASGPDTCLPLPPRLLGVSAPTASRHAATTTPQEAPSRQGLCPSRGSSGRASEPPHGWTGSVRRRGGGRTNSRASERPTSSCPAAGASAIVAWRRSSARRRDHWPSPEKSRAHVPTGARQAGWLSAQPRVRCRTEPVHSGSFRRANVLRQTSLLAGGAQGPGHPDRMIRCR